MMSKEQIYQLLQADPDAYLSGQELSRRLGLHGVAHRHGGHARHAHEGLRQYLGAQEDGEVDPPPGGRLEGAGHAAPPGALAVGHRHGPVGRSGQGLPFQVGVGGVDLLRVRPQIKWTNDLVLNGKKICGILTEMAVEGETGMTAPGRWST